MINVSDSNFWIEVTIVVFTPFVALKKEFFKKKVTMFSLMDL